MIDKKINYDFIALPKGVQKELSGNDLKLFITLFDEWNMMKNEDGWFFRSQKDLIKDSVLSESTIKRSIKSLIEKGFILTTSYNDGFKKNTYNKANEYKIIMENVLSSSEKGVILNHRRGSKRPDEGVQNDLPSKNIKTKNKKTNKKENIIKEKNNNNLSTIDLNVLETKVTEDKKENIIKEKVNEMKNVVLNEMELEVKNNNKDITSTVGEENTNFKLKNNSSSVVTDEDFFNEIFGVEEQSEIAENIDNDILTSTLVENNTSNAGSEDSKNSNLQFSLENCQNKATGGIENSSMGKYPSITLKLNRRHRKSLKTQLTLKNGIGNYIKYLIRFKIWTLMTQNLMNL
ncbi:helix-turn-helix domain-containing protein [Prevotella koreensis]